jgi:hypothetical protein
LQYKFIATRTDDDNYRQLIAEKKDVRVSSFDILPGLNPIKASLLGLMHAAFLRELILLGIQNQFNSAILLGMMSIVHCDILHAGGMFTICSKKNMASPVDHFDKFLETIWWPGDSGRVKTQVCLPCAY